MKPTPPFTVVLLVSLAVFPIHALVSPSGDSILLSQDPKVPTLRNIQEIIEDEFTTYDQFLIEYAPEFKLFHEVVLDLSEESIFPKTHSDLLEDSLCIIRSLFAYKDFIEKELTANAMRVNPKDVSEKLIMKKSIEHAILLDKLVIDLSSNIERLQALQV